MSQDQLEKLKEAEEKEKTTIQAIQQEIDESAKAMASQNAEHLKQKEELEDKNPTSPIANVWNKANSSISISTNGLNATNNANGRRSVSAEKGYVISVDFPGPAIYYFEVTITKMSSSHRQIHVGLASGNAPNGSILSISTNSYAIANSLLSGNEHDFEEWTNDATKPESKGQGDVLGCGLLLNAENEVSIFFTSNGLLMGKQISINSTTDTLYPTVSMDGSSSVEANFGDDSAKPFQYDIKKGPGLVFK